MALFAVSVLMLGYTRLQGVVAYNSKTRAFDELTPAVARRYINSGDLIGLKWVKKDCYDGGEFVPDQEGFNKQNIMIKTAAGRFRPMSGDRPGLPVNSMYNVVRVIKTDYRGTLFEVVSNRYDRLKLTEEQLRGLNNVEPIAGVWIHEDNIEIASIIPIEDRTQTSGETTEQIENTAEGGESGEITSEPLAESVESAESTESENTENNESESGVESVEAATPADEPLTMEDVFGSAGVDMNNMTTEDVNPDAETDIQAEENQDQPSESERQPSESEQPVKMMPIFETPSDSQEPEKTAGNKSAGGKHKKSAANKRK